MTEIESILLIDNNELDNFINHKFLEAHGVTNILSFNHFLKISKPTEICCSEHSVYLAGLQFTALL